MPSTSRSAQIAQIIQKRHPVAQKIDTVVGNLRALSAALRKLERQRDHLLDKVDATVRLAELGRLIFLAFKEVLIMN